MSTCKVRVITCTPPGAGRADQCDPLPPASVQRRAVDRRTARMRLSRWEYGGERSARRCCDRLGDWEEWQEIFANDR
jgi:hypothetical protein